MRIGEVARRSGVSARMLRHYERLGLLVPAARTASGYRDYTETDLVHLTQIEGLRALGMTLAQVAEALDSEAAGPEALIADLAEQTRARIERDTALLARLTTLTSVSPGNWDAALAAVRLARGLESPIAGERQRAALELGASPQGAPAAQLIDALLAEESTNAAGALRWALVQSGSGAEVLREALRDPDPTRRARALAAAAQFPGDVATELILPLLDDPIAVIRQDAALAAGARSAGAAVPVLLGLVVSGPRDVEAAEALAEIARDRHAEREILIAIEAALGDPVASGAARGRLTQALGEFDPRATAPLLTALAADQDRAVALTARYLLQRGT
ncbi:transcriptional regulator [Leucobacter komagatae]|uniref:Transcriptional regulator n=1 Tax=Leucobacter komagatae TaxID=55969 RepID=A0A542Y579_9MICO|nr:MerR family transcriptional regulator [Leucobacter komagatae]TQL43240.1 transcriptional regulator [Leucobacter komagatae]